MQHDALQAVFMQSPFVERIRTRPCAPLGPNAHHRPHLPPWPPPSRTPQLLVVLESAAEVYSATLSHFCSCVKYRNAAMRITATTREQGSSNVWTGHQGGTVRLYMAADGAGGSRRSAWGMLSHTQGGDSGAALMPFRPPGQVRFQPPLPTATAASSLRSPSANPRVARQQPRQLHPLLQRRQHSGGGSDMDSDSDHRVLSAASLLASDTLSQHHSGAAAQPSFNTFNRFDAAGGDTRGVRLGPKAPHLMPSPTADPFKRAQRFVSTIGPVRPQLQEGEAPSDVTIRVSEFSVTALASCDDGSLWVGDAGGGLASLLPSEIGAVLQTLVSTGSGGGARAGVTALLVQGGIVFAATAARRMVALLLLGRRATCPRALCLGKTSPPRPPLGGSSHWNMRCSVFKAHKGKMTACAVMGSSIATGSAAGGVKIVDATDLHTQALRDGISFGPLNHILCPHHSLPVSVASGVVHSPRSSTPADPSPNLQPPDVDPGHQGPNPPAPQVSHPIAPFLLRSDPLHNSLTSSILSGWDVPLDASASNVSTSQAQLPRGSEQRSLRLGGSGHGPRDGRQEVPGLSALATSSQKTLARSNSGMSADSQTSGHSSDGLEEADPSISLQQQAANKKRMRTVKRIQNSATIIRWGDIIVGAKIGEGSEGTVWRGTFMHGPVAIKEMHPKEHRKSTFSRVASMCDSIHHYSQHAFVAGVPVMELRSLDPVLKEVSTFMDLHHPYIVRYIGIVLDPPRIITEYHERGSLNQVIKRTTHEQWDVQAKARKDLSWGNRLQMLRDIASGMSYLHMRNYIHGDLRSPNVLLSSEGHCKIADFGFAKLMGSDEGASFTAAKVTNPRWLAPEALKVHSISAKSDVFSFAIIMFEMLTWKLPYDGLMSVQVSHQLDRRPELRPTLPEELPVPNAHFNTISIRLRALAHWQTCMAKVRLHVKATAAVWSLVLTGIAAPPTG
ncbi:MAG: hypothetical protein WDW38_011188 [Sanguina aurantia]